MTDEIKGEQLTEAAKENGSLKDMGEFNDAVRSAVRGEKTPYVLGGEEQKRVNLINKNINRIKNYMKNIGYVIPSDERSEYMDVIEKLQNGEIVEIPPALLRKIEHRETVLEEFEKY